MTKEDLALIANPLLFKVHGCATRLLTLLASTSQLASPDDWASEKVRERLAGSDVAFLGLGDPPPYVTERLRELAAVVRQPHVVSPSIRSNWDGSTWSRLLPTLADGKKLGMTADAMLDQLLRAYLRVGLLDRIRGQLGNGPGTGVIDLLCARAGLALIRWLRRSSWQWRTGSTVVRSDQAFRAVLALAFLSEARELSDVGPGAPDAAPVLVEGERSLQLLIADRQPRAIEVVEEIHRRSREARRRGDISGWGSARVTVICVGHLYSIAQRSSMTRDLVDAPQGSDILEGPDGAEFEFLDANEVIGAAG